MIDSSMDWSISLPLMGIWNLLINGAEIQSYKLITPHGDLEPRSSARARDCHRSSLPLMGIWNLSRRCNPISCLHLITPHGDLEPARSSASAASPLRLITPHGDLELHRSRRR